MGFQPNTLTVNSVDERIPIKKKEIDHNLNKNSLTWNLLTPIIPSRRQGREPAFRLPRF